MNYGHIVTTRDHERIIMHSSKVSLDGMAGGCKEMGLGWIKEGGFEVGRVTD
jgi:hypothetical protein